LHGYDISYETVRKAIVRVVR